MTLYVETDMRLSPDSVVRRHDPTNASAQSIQKRRWLLLVCVLAMLVLIAVAMDEILRPQKFPLQNISISNELKHITRADIEAAITPQIQGNYFSLNLNQIEKAIKALPWVESAKVRRRWPRNLDIDVREHRPVAQWGNQSWMNSAGEIFTVDYQDAGDYLPRFNAEASTNKKVLEHYRRWAVVLAGTGLQIKAITLSARYEWSLEVYLKPSQLSSASPTIVGGQPLGAQKRRGSIGMKDQDLESLRSVTVVLGRYQVDVRLARFARVFKDTLLTNAAHINRVDLRYPNGFAIQWKEQDFDPEFRNSRAPFDSFKKQKTHYSKLLGLELKDAVGR